MKKNISEAREVDKQVIQILDNLKIEYIKVDGNQQGCEEILKIILNKLNKKEK